MAMQRQDQDYTDDAEREEAEAVASYNQYLDDLHAQEVENGYWEAMDALGVERMSEEEGWRDEEVG